MIAICSIMISKIEKYLQRKNVRKVYDLRKIIKLDGRSDY